MINREARASAREKAASLAAKMTLDEKISQMTNSAGAVERLGIPAYNYWNEALHGVARAGVATVFPQAIALAATFDDVLVEGVANVISDEARAKYDEFQRRGDRGIYKGLTFWSPNINIFRDPRWGRGHETYGEDPRLTSRLGCAFVRGMQGDDPEHLKTAACAKHFAVHSGPEKLRHGFTAKVSEKDLRETYLKAFEALVGEGVEAVMGAYNSVGFADKTDEACCASERLLNEILRGEWGFEGHVVSDCGAVRDIYEHHRAADSVAEAAAMSVKAGCDLNCGSAYLHLRTAVAEGLIGKDEITEAVTRLLTTRFLLGILGDGKYEGGKIDYSEVACGESLSLSIEAAAKGLVLLKNDGLLPFDAGKSLRIAVVGPNADRRSVLEGNYCGTSPRYMTLLDGFRAFEENGSVVTYAEGSHLWRDKVEGCAEQDDRIAEAVSAALRADVTIVCVGLDPTIEGEEGDAFSASDAGDKRDLELPEGQKRLLDAILSLERPTVVVNVSGSAVNLSDAGERANAVIQCFYPGAMGGLAVAGTVFGMYSPSGKLPVTFYRSAADLPEFTDYSMEERTYRYFHGEPLYPFGFGLSYTRFNYGMVSASFDGEKLAIECSVENAGELDSETAVQVYVSCEGAPRPAPVRTLADFRKIFMEAGQKRTMRFEIPVADFAPYGKDGRQTVPEGAIDVWVGGSQPDDRSAALGADKCAHIRASRA